LKILYLVHQFFPKYYFGTERFTLNLSSQMRRLGHHSIILTYDRKASNPSYRRLSDGIYVKAYDYDQLPVISFLNTSLSPSQLIYDRQMEAAFPKLKLGELDIVHVTHPMWLASIAKRCKTKHGLPIVLTLTDTWLLCPRGQIDRNFRFCKGPTAEGGCPTNCIFKDRSKTMLRHSQAINLLNLADEVVTASKLTAETFRNNGWNGPIRIITHSIDYRHIRRSEPDSSKFSLVFIGSFSLQKGLHVLLRAMQKVHHPRVALKVYAPLKDNPRYAAKFLELARGDPRIDFLGEFDLADFPRIMAGASALVVPSVYPDNYPTVVLLSLACGVPVIGSNVGGIPEIIQNGANGILFEPGNSDQLASTIEELAINPDKIRRLREKIVSPRRSEEEAFDYEGIYEKLVSRSS